MSTETEDRKVAETIAPKDTAIRAAKPTGSLYELKLAGYPGLRLAIQPSGVKSFVLRYTLGGRYRKVTLGQYGKITLGDAFDRYADANALIAKGIDPVEDRKAAKRPKADTTVTAAIATYERLRLVSLREGTQRNIRKDLGRIKDALGNRDLSTITREDIQGLIDEAIARGQSARNMMFKNARAFFTWSFARLGKPSPGATIKRPSKDGVRTRFLKDPEIAEVWRAATETGGAAGAVTKLLLLTGCRRNEIFDLRHSEVRADTIALPSERTKNGIEHTIPITAMMREVLDALPKTGEFVITGTDKTLAHAHARNRIKTPSIAPWVFHDLRRTFVSGLARLGVSITVAEKAVNHISGESGDPLRRIYDQHTYETEIFDAFAKWSKHVEKLVQRPVKLAA